MFRLITFALLLAGCPGGGGSMPGDKPDAAPMPMPDAPKPTPDAPPLRGYGQSCTAASQCASGLCIGETAGAFQCSIPCNIDAANDCRSVDAFCVPIGGGDHGCWGMIETGNDLDDAILNVGDSAQRAVTPLGDADLFQVRYTQIGTIRFTVTPSPTIDVRLEAYGMLGAALATANNAGPSGAESLETDVQQLGGHVFIVVRNVGNSTGNYTFTAQRVTTFAPGDPWRAAGALQSAPEE